MAISDLFNATVTIQTQQVATGNISFDDSAWLTVRANVRCKREYLSSDAVLAYGRQGLIATDKFTFVEDPQVSIGDRIIYNGQPYRVRKPEHRRQGTIEYWAAVAEQVAH